jgi:GNAT superfamily N-acetyltransferase
VGAPGRTFFLAYVGDEPAGFVSLRTTEPPAGLQNAKAIELVQIYSEKKMIGQGIGHALMEAALEYARQQGYDWIWLGVWEHNHRAKAFYQKWGFEHCGEHVFIVGLDAQTDWWMKKKLG